MQALAHTPLFDGLTDADLELITGQMRHRHVPEREVICREGEPGKSLFVIQDGLALVLVSSSDAGPEPVARLRRGDVVGEMSLISGEPRSATVIAAIPTSILELDDEAFAEILSHYPAILSNLNRILSQRLARTTALQRPGRRRGEAIALLVGGNIPFDFDKVIAATKATAVRGVQALDVRRQGDANTLAGSLAALDDLLEDHGCVVIIADLFQDDVPMLLNAVDRCIALASPEDLSEVRLRFQNAGPLRNAVELMVWRAPREDSVLYATGALPVTRCIDLESERDIAWLGRHLARTKLGLALGAGGAKGYAHIGAISILERAGYVVDYVSGSSIGALVGAWLAMGMSAGELEQTMRSAFTPEAVAAMFKLSITGASSGLDVMVQMCRYTTRELDFSDLLIPLVSMSVDLNTRQPAPIRDGPVWEALVAATALAGMFPPHQRGSQRLVDGLALVPVPTSSVLEAGADVTVSVNIMSRDTLPAWPNQVPPEPAPAKSGSRMLDTLLEVMDLAQLDSSMRHAALADVVITPRFGPSSWRDFHLADLFLTAGRQAAEEQLAALHTFTRPQIPNYMDRGGLHGRAVRV